MQVNMYGAAIAARKSLAEQTRQQRNQSNADQCDTAASHELCYPQLVGTIQLSGGRRHVKKYIWSF